MAEFSAIDRSIAHSGHLPRISFGEYAADGKVRHESSVSWKSKLKSYQYHWSRFATITRSRSATD
jgi:hypothetical protein